MIRSCIIKDYISGTGFLFFLYRKWQFSVFEKRGCDHWATELSCYATRFSSGLMFLLFLLLSLRISLVVYSEFVQVERSNNIHATFEMVSTLPPIYHQHSNFWLNLNCQNTSCDICKIFKNNNHNCHVASNRAINIK